MDVSRTGSVGRFGLGFLPLGISLGLVAVGLVGCGDPIAARVGTRCEFLPPPYSASPPGVSPITGVDTTPRDGPELLNICCPDHPFEKLVDAVMRCGESGELCYAADNRPFDVPEGPHYPWYGATLRDGDGVSSALHCGRFSVADWHRGALDITCNLCPNGIGVLQGIWRLASLEHRGSSYCGEQDVLMRIDGNTYERLERDVRTGEVFRHAGYYYCGVGLPARSFFDFHFWISFVPTEMDSQAESTSSIPRPLPMTEAIVSLYYDYGGFSEPMPPDGYRVWDYIHLSRVDGWYDPPPECAVPATTMVEDFCRVGGSKHYCKLDAPLFGLDEQGQRVGPGLPDPVAPIGTCW